MLQLAKHRTLTTEPVYKFQNNHSVSFDGTESLDLGEPISYTQHTISAWVKITDTSSSKIIFDARDAAEDGIRIRTNASEQIIYELNDNSITSPLSYVNEWIHIVASYDGGTQKLYINSSLIGSVVIDVDINTTTNAKIGTRNFDTPAVFFVGNIDEIGIWDRALSAEEVEEIYRIKYGANLVQNGRFDELGSELVTNGDFSTSGELTTTSYNLGWLKFSSDTGSSISDGVLNLVHQAGGGFKGRIQLSNGVNSAFTYSGDGETYKLVYEVKENIANSSLFVWSGHNYISIPKTVGTHTVYYASTTTGTLLNLVLRNGTDDSTIKLDNISIKQVDPNVKFTLGTGFSFGDSKVIFSGTDYSSLTTTSNLLTSGKTYRVNLSATVTNGSFKLQNGGVDVITGSATNNYSAIFTSNSNTFNISRAGVGIQNDFTITNLMIEEQKYVASNLKLKSGNYTPFAAGQSSGTFALKNYYRMGDGILDRFPLICDMMQPSLGNEIITNGDFSTSGTPTNTSFTLGWRVPADSTDNVEIVNGTATITNPDGGGGKFFATNGVDSSSVVVSGRLYKLVYTVTENEGCTTLRYHTGSAYVDAVESVGTHTIYYVATGTIFLFRNLSTGSTIKLDNVSLKQVNGVPAFMTNMSAGNITNDVPRLS